MTRTRRKLLLTMIASVLGATAAIPMIVSGTANAQAGSRICGRKWWTTGESGYKEVVFKIWEVRKNFGDTECNEAKSEGNDGKDPFNAPFDLGESKADRWDGMGIRKTVCEDFTRELVGNPARAIEFVGDDWPARDQYDICNNMRRTDFWMNPQNYWLYLSNWESNAAEGPWKFIYGVRTEDPK